MMYLTGPLAFGVDCERESCGRWNIPKTDWLNEDLMVLKDSEESPFKSYGIEENKIVPYHEFCTYNVADHVRAYCDMLYAGKFDELKDVFGEYIRSMSCRKDIFMLVYGKLKYLAEFHDINAFMEKEFGNAWVSYIDSVNSVAEHISNRAEAIERLESLQQEQEKVNPLYQAVPRKYID